mmetsp:Transcript_19227/g.59289  ORF Transcript_19227/g.59289 Transcript_19227/m.59289 type:complete len:634 (-) Transcript_19227:308-2209(-)
MPPVRKSDAALLELGAFGDLGDLDLELLRAPQVDDLGGAAGSAGLVEESSRHGPAEGFGVRREAAELVRVDAPLVTNYGRPREPQLIVRPELDVGHRKGPVVVLGKIRLDELDAADMVRRAHKPAIFEVRVLVLLRDRPKSIHFHLALVRRQNGARLLVFPDEDRPGLDVPGADVASIGGEDLLVVPEAQVHRDALVDLLPEMRAEDLNQRYLKRRNLAVHEDAGQVELDLEADVDVGAIDRRRPPEREAAVRDLVQPGALRVGQLLVLHGLFEAARFLPEEAFPRREVRALEERVLEDALDAAEGLDHVRAVVVEVPQLAVVPCVGPPEGILAQDLVLLEVGADAPALVVGECVAVFLEECRYPRQSAVPGVLEVLEREAAVLGGGLLALEGVLGPDALGVDELGLPGLDVAEEVGDDLVFLVRHARPEVRHALVRLLGVPEVRLRNQHVAHRQHPEAAEFLGRVEQNRREARGHLGVESDLDARLDLVFALDEEVEHFLGVDDGLAEVGHEPDERGVPLVGDLRKSRRARRHQDLAHAVLERAKRLLVDAQKGLGRHFLGGVVLQIPDAVAVREGLEVHADLGLDAHLEAAHVEQQVRVVFRVNGHEGVLPVDGRHGAREPVLDVPEGRAA